MATNLDLSGILQYDLQRQQLDEQRRRNDLYERHVAVQQQQADEVARAHQERERIRAINIGMKLVDDPTIPLQTKAVVYRSLANLAGFGDLEVDDLLGAEDSLKTIGRAFLKQDRQGLEQGIVDLSLRFPDLALKNLEILSKTQGLTEKAEAHGMTLKLHAEQLRKLQQQDAAVTASRYSYQPVVEQFESHLRLFGDIGTTLYAQSPKARQAIIKATPDLQRFFDELRDRRDVSAMMEREARKEEEYWAAQLRAVDMGESHADPSVIELRRAAAHRVAEARKREQQWLTGLHKDQWNKQDFDAFLEAQRGLETAMHEAKQHAKLIADERLALQTQKFDDQTRYRGQVAAAQALVLERYGYEPPSDALAKIAKQHGVKASDVLHGLTDPAKKSKLSIELAPRVKADLQDTVIKFETLAGTIRDIRKIVMEHPEAVGLTGNLRRAIGGIAQQTYTGMRSAFRADTKLTPGARERLSKLFGTQPEDELEALAIGLTYKLARVMSGAGVMSDLDVGNAERMVSPLRSWIGPDQFLNHLGAIERETRRMAEESKAVLKSGSVLRGEPRRAVSEMNDEELLRELLGEMQP